MSKISEIAIVDENEQSTTYEIQDASLTLEVASLNERLTAIEEGGIPGGSGLTDDIKTALLQLARNVVFLNDAVQTYDDLYDALYPPIPATSITLNTDLLYLHSVGETSQLVATVLPSDTTDVVTWSSSDNEVITVSSDGLVTAVDLGEATITATAGEQTATCSVVVATAELLSISAVYTQSGNVYRTQTVDVLKNDLVVTAYYNDSTSSVVTDYVLSGTLTAGTSTITVTYSGKSATFDVTVTDAVYYDIDPSKLSMVKNKNLKPFYENDSTRLSYRYFDIFLSGGKSYHIVSTSTVQTAQFGAQFYGSRVLDQVTQNTNYTSSDIYDPGWQPLETTIAVPQKQNGYNIVGVRFTYRKDTNNSAFTENVITSIIIEEVTA